MPSDSFPDKSDLLRLSTVLRLGVDDGSAVYFLCEGLEIVYVGESVGDVPGRVRQHRKKGWQFDDVLVQPCRAAERVLLERAWIEKIRPRYNIAYGHAGWPAGLPPRFGVDVRRARPTEASMSTDLVDPLASVRAYIEAEKAENTRRAYRTDWADFLAWCEKVDERPLPAAPEAVARYLAWLADAGLNPSTITRRAAGIRYAHKAAGFEPPTNVEGVRATLRGIRRMRGRKPVRKRPATAELLEQALAALPDSLRGKRDRAVLLVGFSAARRRSEIVALTTDDVEFFPKGMLVHIGRSKTDQEGKGQIVPVPRGNLLRPVDALEAWLEAAEITSGPLFRQIDRHGNLGDDALCDRTVARIVKAAFGPLGVDVRDFSGHSLRAGFVTSSLDRKVDPFKIMKVTGHKKVDTLQIYDRRDRKSVV